LDLLEYVQSGLCITDSFSQALLNHRSRAYGGGYRAEIVLFFLSSAVGLLHFVPAVVGRLEMRMGLTPTPLILLGTQLPLVWQAFTLQPVEYKEDEED
jgi:hypothetical protein